MLLVAEVLVCMSQFLGFLRGVFGFLKGDGDRNENGSEHRNTSGETTERPCDAPVLNRPITGSRLSNSAKETGSPYAKPVERTYDAGISSNSSTRYAPVPSYRLPQSSTEKLASPANSAPSRPELPTSSSTQSVVPNIHSTKPSPSVPISYSKPSPSFATQAASSSNPVTASPKAPPSAFGTLPSFKQTLAPASSNSNDQQSKGEYILVQKDLSPIYLIPRDIQDLIKRDEVPEILRRPLSMSSYKDYFGALLCAEDYYIEKWSEFKLLGITLKLQEAAIFKGPYIRESYEKDEKIFVAFNMDSSLEKRPFLLSRDFVFAKSSGSKTDLFQGIIYRVERSTTILVEFGEDFHAQHYPSMKYDVSFSFNRVCLKRAHQAVEAASDPSFESYIFPCWGSRKIVPSSSPNIYYNNKLHPDQNSAVRQIIAIQGPPPYLIEGQLCVDKRKWSHCSSNRLSRTGLVVQQAVLEIFRSSRKHRILICAPINSTCDVLMTSLKEIPETEMFRANAAFREIDGVPSEILASSLYKGECFACPPLQELQEFKVILSTYMSSFRLHNEGIPAGHFSHIFMLDASSAAEPEAMVALANLANENTAVIVTGSLGNHPGWVRSNIARKNGLIISYFKRLRERNPYDILDSNYITKLAD
ncbi:probable RNA helicase SDE3 isoform X2 [Ricinus communis]|uniref:probable RNA helicase SDE3 isoform X2 n=1 Tax=Ricinus communis TaxID=3988 RepID=UPI00201A87D1|nr:probable RNA helicase SDE3 isoform X2 [Ricinus communis]